MSELLTHLETVSALLYLLDCNLLHEFYDQVNKTNLRALELVLSHELDQEVYIIVYERILELIDEGPR